MHVLFFSRLALYLIAFLLPVIHPAVSVSYDAVGWWIWFFLVPAQMLVAHFASPPRRKLRTWLGLGLSILAVSEIFIVFKTGLGEMALLALAIGIASFVITALIFHGGERWATVAAAEPLFLAWLYYRMLNFSRSDEEIATRSAGLAQIILVGAVVALLAHGVILYLSLHRGAARRGIREIGLFAGLAAALLAAVILLVPPDFVMNTRIANQLRPEAGGGSGTQRGADGGPDKQYTVMVIASPTGPIYAATAYRGVLDPVTGFSLSPGEGLNDLTYRRLLETWVDPQPPLDAARVEVPVFTLSTIPDRALAYRPSRVEPTVLDRRYHPLDYSFAAISSLSVVGPEEWRDVPDLLPETRAAMEEYLVADLDEESRGVFQNFLDNALAEGGDGWVGRIYSILRSFSAYQYEIGYEEDVSIRRMVEFLGVTRTGDCTEFSNTAGILGRLAGIPSRVVVGYLASRDLQTDGHRQGLLTLRELVEPLQRYDIEDLYLVTTAHRHSWVQFYLPGYGWADFDPTSFAIPPAVDFNQSEVVIPTIVPQPNPRVLGPFPWRALLKGLALAVAGLTVGLYLFRYGREALLAARSRRRDLTGLRATERLLLMRLAAEGCSIKHAWETPLEYARRLPELLVFAGRYTELRYQDPVRAAEGWIDLQGQARGALARCRRTGLGGAVRRALSLRPLHY